MGSKNDLSNRINVSYIKLRKGQKMLATYITDNYYNLIETEVAVAQIEKVIEEHSESLDDIQITDDEQQEATSTLLGSMPFDF